MDRRALYLANETQEDFVRNIIANLISSKITRN